jgi:hypothetical protein
MPTAGAAVTAAAATVLTGSTAANPPYLLPGNFFAPGSANGPGKSLLVKGGGWFSTGTTSDTDIIGLYLDPTANSTTSQVTVAKTGAFAISTTAITNGAWTFEILMTMTQAGSSTTAGTLNAVGNIQLGAGNNLAAPTFGTFGTSTTALWCGMLMGAPQTAVNITFATPYYLEMWNTWSATTGAPTITLTNFYVFGLN